MVAQGEGQRHAVFKDLQCVGIAAQEVQTQLLRLGHQGMAGIYAADGGDDGVRTGVVVDKLLQVLGVKPQWG